MAQKMNGKIREWKGQVRDARVNTQCIERVPKIVMRYESLNCMGCISGPYFGPGTCLMGKTMLFPY